MPQYQRYRAYRELEDGSTLTMEYWCKVWPATRWEPEDVDMSDPEFFIDGQAIKDEELPAEITMEVIDALCDEAKYVEPDFKEPDEEY